MEFVDKQYDQRDIIPELGGEAAKLVFGVDHDLCKWCRRHRIEVYDAF